MCVIPAAGAKLMTAMPRALKVEGRSNSVGVRRSAFVSHRGSAIEEPVCAALCTHTGRGTGRGAMCLRNHGRGEIGSR